MSSDTKLGSDGGPTQIITDIFLGAFWLFETAPLTTISALGLAFSYFGGVSEIPTDKLIWLPALVLVDGFVGRRHAQREEQKMMNDFHRWHAEEITKAKEDSFEI